MIKRIENILLCQGSEGPIQDDTRTLIYYNSLAKTHNKYLEERDGFYNFYIHLYKLKPHDIIKNIDLINSNNIYK